MVTGIANTGARLLLGCMCTCCFPLRQKPMPDPAPRLLHTVTCKENLAHTLAQCVPFYKHKPGISVLW